MDNGLMLQRNRTALPTQWCPCRIAANTIVFNSLAVMFVPTQVGDHWN